MELPQLPAIIQDFRTNVLKDGPHFLLPEPHIPPLRAEEVHGFLHGRFPDIPPHFMGYLRSFYFDNWTIGPIAFGQGRDYFSTLISYNTPDANGYDNWWDSGDRPSRQIMIAISDGFVVTLDCGTGLVHAMRNDDSPHEPASAIAADFDVFVRLAYCGLIFRLVHKDTREVCEWLAKHSGVSEGSDFWVWLCV
ncbi:MAG: hypothetical protein NT069_21715 [Planctomycetota bacterium]|nr:hypothetical protein [Planctomycetota bacterium]